MMICQKKAVAIFTLLCLTLSGCSSNTTEEPSAASSAKSAIAIMHFLSSQSTRQNRPSAALGMFTGIYLAQGIFLTVVSAPSGIASIAHIIQGQISSTTDENYALLQEVGDVLQISIVDTLNRSSDRLKTLDEYISSLRSTGQLIERKITELEALDKEQKAQVSEDRTAARDVERSLNEALNKKDYATAAQYERQVADAKAKYGESTTLAEQTKDMKSRFSTLYDVTRDRLQVLENNREILIAGLRVIDLPGIADYNILEKGKSWRTRKGSRIFDSPQSIQ